MTTTLPPPHPMLTVALSDRDRIFTPVPGKRAAVALATVQHPSYGDCLVITRRSLTNGHTGEPISFAGKAVLPGGRVEPGEEPYDAAVRELCEETGTLALRPQMAGGSQKIGGWVTEAGHSVESFAIRLPRTFVNVATVDPREVASLGYLPVSAILRADVTREFHTVQAGDHRLSNEPIAVESPTLRIPDPDSTHTWVLSGLAGHMVTQWRQQIGHSAPNPGLDLLP